MIKNRPCCDNCPHYTDDDLGFLKEADGTTFEEFGACLFDAKTIRLPHVGPHHRCSHHPWIESATETLVVAAFSSKTPMFEPISGLPSPEQTWGNYIAGLPALLAIVRGGEPAAKPVLPPEWWKLDVDQVVLLSKEGAIIGNMNFEGFKAASRREFRCTTIDEIVRGGCVDPFVVFRGRGADGVFHDRGLVEQPLSWFGPAPDPEVSDDEAVERR